MATKAQLQAEVKRLRDRQRVAFNLLDRYQMEREGQIPDDDPVDGAIAILHDEDGPRPAIETDYLRLYTDDPVLLRDFIARAEADLASPTGLTQTWPGFAADVRRAVELARRALGEGE